jgi:hypothetical protein
MNSTEFSPAHFVAQYFAATRNTVELRALPSKARTFTRSQTEVDRFIQDHAHENVYFGCATREGGGTKTHCREVPALWVDIDFKTTPEPKANELIKALVAQPSIVIESGGGLHLYWLLDIPVDAHDERIEPILRGLAAALGGDPAAAEISRIMRLPGTLNRKPEYGAPRKCQVITADWNLRYALVAFDSFRMGSKSEVIGGSAVDVICESKRNATLTSMAGKLRRIGLNENELRASLLEINRRCAPPLDESEVESIARSVARYSSIESEHSSSDPWGRAQEAPAFLAKVDEGIDFLEPRMLAPGAVTEVFSPRGLGKSLVAQHLAVKLARSGKRGLFLDRDNPPREVRTRLRSWGAAETPGLRVMTREVVPPLTNHAAWQKFPLADYDFVILDALDSAAEGVGEQDSAKPSRAIAPLLDIAHREGGPAVLILGNCVRSGKHSRGSGVIEDRSDISYEIRDATDFKPSGTKPWVEELPAADASSWAARSSRRKARSVYRLAFVPTKFRVGEEPEPFILEINLTDDLWTVREVTDEVDQAGKAARTERQRQSDALCSDAAFALMAEVKRRCETGETPMYKDRDAVPILKAHKITRKQAREIISNRDGQYWRLIQLPGEQGSPFAVLPLDRDYQDGVGYSIRVVGGNAESLEPAPDAAISGLDFRHAPTMRAAEIVSIQPTQNTGLVTTPLSADLIHSSIKGVGGQNDSEDLLI